MPYAPTRTKHHELVDAARRWSLEERSWLRPDHVALVVAAWPDTVDVVVDDGTLTRMPDDAGPATFLDAHARQRPADAGHPRIGALPAPRSAPTSCPRRSGASSTSSPRPTDCTRESDPVVRAASAPAAAWGSSATTAGGTKALGADPGAVRVLHAATPARRTARRRHVPSRRERERRPPPGAAGPATTVALHVAPVRHGRGAACVPFEAREPGKVSIYLCGPTVYGPPHLGHGRSRWSTTCCGAISSGAGSTVALVSNVTDIDDKIIDRANARAATVAEIADQVRGGLVAAMDAHRRARPTDDPARHGVRRRDGGDDRRAGRHRSGVLDRRRRLPLGRDGGGLRPARPPVARRHRSPAAAIGGRRRRRASATRRLRAVEVGQAGRAVVAVAVGRRPSGLAHRVRGDVARPARRGVRPALRRAWTWSSRTTRTSGPRRSPSASASPTTGCTTGSSSTPRARRCRRGSATSRTCST